MSPAALVIQEAGHRLLWSDALGLFCSLSKVRAQAVNTDSNIDYFNQYPQLLPLLHFYDILYCITLSTPIISKSSTWQKINI